MWKETCDDNKSLNSRIMDHPCYGQGTPPLTEPAGNACQVLPTVKMMGTAKWHHRRWKYCVVSTRPRKGQALLKQGGWVLVPLDQNPGTADGTPKVAQLDYKCQLQLTLLKKHSVA